MLMWEARSGACSPTHAFAGWFCWKPRVVPARAWSCFSLRQHRCMAQQQPCSPLSAFTSAFAICLARFLSYGEGMSEQDKASWLQLSRGRSAIAGLSCHLCVRLCDRAGVSPVSAGTGSSCFCWTRAWPQVGTQLVQGVDLNSVSKGHFSELKLQWFVLLMCA